MVVQPNFNRTTKTPSWRCQCLYNGQTAATRLYTWLWQARTHHHLAHRLHVLHTSTPQTFCGLLEWPRWLCKQGHIFWHTTKHVHFFTFFTCNSGQPIRELIVAMVNMAEYHLAPELPSHLHNATKPRKQLWLTRLGPALQKSIARLE